MKIYDLAKRMIKLSGLRYPEDIDIKITGLRPGEKLYEELFTENENSEKTQHKKIMIARVCYNFLDDFDVKVDEIIRLNRKMTIENGQTNDLILLLKKLVPEYCPQNTVY